MTTIPSGEKRQVQRDENMSETKISHIQFGMFGPPEVSRLAEFDVTSDRAYEMPKPEEKVRMPVVGGVLDRRLGVSDKASTCETCGLRMNDCPGHFAEVRLELPVFHIGYLKPVVALLQTICKDCARVLLPQPERTKMLRALCHPMTRGDSVRMGAAFKRVVERCKKVRECPYCGARNGLVRKVGFARIVHEKIPPKENSDRAHRERDTFVSSFEHATGQPKGAFENPVLAGSDVAELLPKAQDDLTPLRVKALLRAIVPADLPLLDMSATHGRPEALLVERLLVPPVPIRPSVMADPSVGSNEDDLTVKLSQIITVNNAIRCALSGGKATVAMLMEDWDYLQLQVAMYINGANVPGVRPDWQAEKRPIRAYAQRLKGKQGRFRGNLSGKRVDFSGRTVISPDPNLAIDEVGVPDRVARVLTYPERVHAHNLSLMRKLVVNGPNLWPGANYVETEAGKRSLKFGERRRVAAELKVGDVVERHLTNGDVVLFNRQPSLHKLSIMAHRARVVPWRTFRFNECVCAPYNADFDGDEMNLHLPQTEEARAEALCLMGVHANLVTPRNGEMVIAATQDFITGAYLMSKQGMFFPRDGFTRLVAYMSDAAEPIELPPPAILKPVELWTGKQLFTCMLRPSRASAVFANLETKNKSYNPLRQKPEPEAMCPADGWVVFQNSEHLCGSLDKSQIGGGNKASLLSVLLRENSEIAAAQAMERLARVTSRFLADYGFSIGVQDVQPTPRLTEAKAKLLASGYAACSGKIREFESGQLTPAPGCTAEQTLESEINGLLSRIRDDAGEICKRELHRLNAPLTMATCGSKGSSINISQMIACVGQQSVGGRRMPNGFIHRALPHFPRHSRAPPDKGFVANSFYTGLAPTEFFFHTMGGREGLVDTAVKTAETGYMQRRLMKALEDLTVSYDGSVRNSEANLVQFHYGDDELDPAMMEDKDGRPVNFERTLLHQRALVKLAAAKPRDGAAAASSAVSSSAASSSAATAPPGLLSFAQAVASFEAFVASPAFTGVVSRTIASEPAKFEVELRAFVASKLLPSLPGAPAHGVALPPPALEPTKVGVGTKSSPRKAKLCKAKLSPLSPAADEGGGAKKRRTARVVLDSDDEDEPAAPEAAAAKAAVDEALIKVEAAAAPPASGGDVLTGEVFDSFLRACMRKYLASKVEPGTAVGAVGAQSIGEPGTQMTLKTFHFAGVASMNITLGVPRIKEIINAAKKISTPIIKAELDQPFDLTAARVVKGRMERTELGQICESVVEVYDLVECYISVKLDLALIERLHLAVTVASVRTSILAAPKMKLHENDVRVRSSAEVRVHPARASREHLALPELHRLRGMLLTVLVCGIKEVTRAVITQKEEGEKSEVEKTSGGPCYKLLVEGAGLRDVLGVRGVRGGATRSTHIAEVEKTLGIEAARQTIMDEIQYTMGQHGMEIDCRHVTLLADVMCFRGEVLGITRFGVPKMKQSVLMLASFEKTTDHLFEAAVHSRTDAIRGVSECIILGIPIPLGTGIFKLLQQVPKAVLPKSEPLLLPSTEKRLRFGAR